MDDYAGDGGPEEIWRLCSFYYELVKLLQANLWIWASYFPKDKS